MTGFIVCLLLLVPDLTACQFKPVKEPVDKQFDRPVVFYVLPVKQILKSRPVTFQDPHENGKGGILPVNPVIPLFKEIEKRPIFFDIERLKFCGCVLFGKMR